MGFPVSRLEVAEFSGVISVITSSLSSGLSELKICSLLLPSLELSGAPLGDTSKDGESGCSQPVGSTRFPTKEVGSQGFPREILRRDRQEGSLSGRKQAERGMLSTCSDTVALPHHK